MEHARGGVKKKSRKGGMAEVMNRRGYITHNYSLGKCKRGGGATPKKGLDHWKGRGRSHKNEGDQYMNIYLLHWCHILN